MFKSLLASIFVALILSSCAIDMPINTNRLVKYNSNLSIEKNITSDSLVNLISSPKGAFEFYDNNRFVKVLVYSNTNIRNYYFLPYIRRSNDYTLDYNTILKDSKMFAYDYYSDYYFIFFNDKLTYWGSISDFKRNTNPDINRLTTHILDNTASLISNFRGIEY